MNSSLHNNRWTLAPQIQQSSLSTIPGSQCSSSHSLNSTASDASCVQQREKRRKERLNSQMIDSVVAGKPLSQIYGTFGEDRAHVWNATCSPTKTSVLHLAALLGNEDVIVAIASNGGCMSRRDHSDRSALHFAAWNGHSECLRRILENGGVDIIDVQTVSERDYRDREPFSSDWSDSWSHNHKTVKDLLPDLPVGSTALHAASIRGHPECIKALIEAGASRDLADDRGLLPLDVLGESVTVKKTERKEKTTQRSQRNITRQSSVQTQSGPKLQSFCSFQTDTPAVHQEAVRDVSVHSRDGSEVVSEDEEPATFSDIAERLRAGVQILRVLDSGRRDSRTPGNEALHHAVGLGLDVLIDYHLTRGADPKSLNPEGDTVIFTALKKRNLIMMEKLLDMFPDLANTPNSTGDLPLHSAVYINDSEAIALLLEYGANPLKLDSQRSSVLHIASSHDETDVLQELLESCDGILQLLESKNDLGNTPLHCAVESGCIKAWRLLVDAGASLDARTNEGKSTLHISIAFDNNDILRLILEESSTKYPISNILDCRDDGGLTPLLLAVLEGNSEAVQLLLDAGADYTAVVEGNVFIVNGSTSLHLAALNGSQEIAKSLIEKDPDLVFLENYLGWPPIYVAAAHGKAEVLRVLLNNGANLASTVQVNKGKKKSTMHEMVQNIRQPGILLNQILDSKISMSDHFVSHPDCVITIKYDLLIPQVGHVTENAGRQMRVVDAILNSGGGRDLKKLITHPLIRSFLLKRWTALAPCYWFLVFLHVLMVAAHTTVILESVWGNSDSLSLFISRITLMVVVLAVASEEIIRASQIFRLYVRDGETWLKWFALFLAAFVALENPEYIHATTRPAKLLEELSSTNTPLAIIARERVWVRHVVALSVLTTWMELLLILSRIPTFGLRVQMFYKVAVSVIKVLLTFSILLLGFSFSFMVQFRGAAPFETILGSLGRTLVMMTSEFDYSNMFADEDGLLSRIPFFLFLIFVAIVLMNLLVGLAVSDITYLEDVGRRRRLEQQAAFLSVLENIIYSSPVQKMFPRKFLMSLTKHISVSSVIEIYPGRPSVSRMSRIKSLPEDLQDEIINIAIANSS